MQILSRRIDILFNYSLSSLPIHKSLIVGSYSDSQGNLVP